MAIELNDKVHLELLIFQIEFQINMLKFLNERLRSRVRLFNVIKLHCSMIQYFLIFMQYCVFVDEKKDLLYSNRNKYKYKQATRNSISF